MRVVIQKTDRAASLFVASEIAKQIRNKPNSVLGLATGSTPLSAYRELVRMHTEEALDFSRVTTFNLDEYVGLSESHPQSYRNFMNENLFHHINIDIAKTFVPNGLANDLVEHCLDYEREIADRGGIDLQLLGIGTDGHIAFNEPGSSLSSRTRIKTLASETIEDNARFFESPSEVPQLAVTMGVGTILDAKRCLLIGTGAHKAEAIKATIEGHVTSQITASSLQLHAKAMIVVDESAASGLQRREYYLRSESAQRQLEKRAQPVIGKSTLAGIHFPTTQSTSTNSGNQI